MYLQFYQLRQAPFQPGAEPAFFWRGEKFLKALGVLHRAIEHGSGVSLLTGDVGTGKTVIVHNLLRLLGRNVMACLISDPGLTAPDFYHLVLHAFGIRRNPSDREDFHRYLKDLLQKAGRRHKKILLLIDEAQRLSPELTTEVLEMAKLPSNTAGTLHVCLVAQTGADRSCIEPVIKVLGQHITADFHIDPLDPAETVDYVHHRLKVAGAAPEIFSDKALEEVFRHSGGYPIQINLICDFSLFSGFAERAPVITEDIVRWSAESLRLPDSADELSDMEILEDEITEESWDFEVSDQFETAEEYAAEADHEIIESDAQEYAPQAPDKVIEPDSPQKPDQFPVAEVSEASGMAADAGFPSLGKKSRSFLKPALATAAALVVLASGYMFYNLKPNPLSGLFNRAAPRISTTSNIPAPEKILPEPVPLSDSRAADQSEPAAAAPEKEAPPAAIEPLTETIAADKTPEPPAPAESQPALAAAPIEEPVTAADQSEPAAAAPDKEAPPAAIEPLTETIAADETLELPNPAESLPAPAQPETRTDITPEKAKPAIAEEPLVPTVVKTDEAKPAITEEAVTPAIIETDQTRPSMPEQPVTPAVAAAVEQPGQQPSDSTSESDVRPALEPETEPSPPQPASPVKEISPPLTAVKKLLKTILEAGAFYSDENSHPEDTNETDTSPRAVPDTSPPGTGPSPAATSDEPDPSDVINWLLKKKGK